MDTIFSIILVYNGLILLICFVLGARTLLSSSIKQDNIKHKVLDSDKKDTIQLVYKHLFNEIKFRRDREFKTLDRISLLLIAIIGFTVGHKEILANICVRQLLFLGTLIITQVAIYYLGKNYMLFDEAAYPGYIIKLLIIRKFVSQFFF